MPTLTLRPIADIAKSGTISYSSGTSAYAMISEVTADDATTTVKFSSANASSTTTSYIKCQLTNSINTNYNVSAVRVYVRWTHSSGTNNSFNAGVAAGSNSEITVSRPSVPTTYTTQTFTMPTSLITQINSGAKQLYLYISCTETGDGSKTVGQSLVTQAYIEVDYTEIQKVYIKVDGTWHTSSSVLVKIDGAWKTMSTLKVKVSDTWHTG